MNKARLRKWLYWIGLILGGGLFLYQIIAGILALARLDQQSIHAWMLLAALGAMLVVVLVQMINWQIILRGLDVRIPFLDISRGYVFSFLPRYIPGSVWGYLSRGEWLFQQHRIPHAVTNSASVLEILITFISGILVIGFTRMEAGGWAIARQAAFSLVLPVAAWKAMVMAAGLFSKKSTAAQAISRMGLLQWLAGILVYMGQWYLLGVATLLAARAFSTAGQVPCTDWLPGTTFAFSLAWMTGFLILFVPGGLGVRELTLTGLLTLAILLPWEQSMLAATSLRVLYSLAESAWLLWAGGMRFLGKKPQKIPPMG